MTKTVHAVVIDDNKDDLFIATRLLRKAGIKNVVQFSRIPETIVYLEDLAEGIRPCPDLIVLDLNVGHDSGFEVLRLYSPIPTFRHATSLCGPDQAQLRENCASTSGWIVCPRAKEIPR